jgi:hypothetical protein
MDSILRLSPDEIRRRIDDSNIQSASTTARYVYWERRAIHTDYDFVPCPCTDDCWCRRHLCAGHYRIKDITFEAFLDSYLVLWIPKNSRKNVKLAVLEGRGFKGRQKNAAAQLKWLGEAWSGVLSVVRNYDKCGLCDLAVPPLVCRASKTLYEGKMWSQLFYDSIVPFDSGSKRRITKAGYSSPTRDFLAMNRQLFADLKSLSDINQLSVPDLRRLDSPVLVDSPFPEPAGGQPLSRVIDKIFYWP